MHQGMTVHPCSPSNFVAWLCEIGECLQRLTADQIEIFTQAFAAMDSDGSGLITSAEFRDVCLSVGMQPTDSELQEMIKELDTDGSGDIDLEEFLKAMQDKLQDPEGEEIISEAFRMFDADGSGALSHAEMKTVLVNLGEKMEDEEVMELINAADVDGDGEVNLKEFLAIVLDRAAV
jgi:calmodulin